VRIAEAATHEADDTALRLAVAETKIEALHAMVEELQRARDSWQAQAERLALIAPTVITAPAPNDAPEDRNGKEPGAASASNDAPEPRRSLLKYWFGLRAAG
jgi:hypothetical protein